MTINHHKIYFFDQIQIKMLFFDFHVVFSPFLFELVVEFDSCWLSFTQSLSLDLNHVFAIIFPVGKRFRTNSCVNYDELLIAKAVSEKKKLCKKKPTVKKCYDVLYHLWWND